MKKISMLILQMMPAYPSAIQYVGWLVQPEDYRRYAELGEDFETAAEKLKTLLSAEQTVSDWQSVYSDEATTAAINDFFFAIPRLDGPVTMLSTYVYAQHLIQLRIQHQLKEALSALPRTVMMKLMSEFETSPVLFNPEVLVEPSVPVFLQYATVSTPE